VMVIWVLSDNNTKLMLIVLNIFNINFGVADCLNLLHPEALQGLRVRVGEVFYMTKTQRVSSPAYKFS
jgi:hypothetical protein